MPKPRHAAALSYDEDAGGAPRVVAAGSGIVAERIIALAREHGVPIHDDAGLAEALARLQLEAEVPEELWKAVAEALVWAYKLTARASRCARGTARAYSIEGRSLRAPGRVARRRLWGQEPQSTSRAHLCGGRPRGRAAPGASPR